MFPWSVWIRIWYSLISVNSVSSIPICIMSYSVTHDVGVSFFVFFFNIVIFVFFYIKIIFTLKIQRNDACLEECHDGCGRIFD